MKLKGEIVSMKKKTERLATAFLRQQEELQRGQDKRQQRQSRLLKKRTTIILYILLMLSIGMMILCGYKAFINTSEVERNRDITRYQDILTEAEQADWVSKSVQVGEAVFQLNLVIPVDADTSRAEIRFIYPPYSDFICKVLIRDVESDLVIYESEEMIPGTLYQYITLSETLTIGKYDAIVEYTFMDGKGKVQGNYDVEVVLEVEEQGTGDSIVNPYNTQ